MNKIIIISIIAFCLFIIPVHAQPGTWANDSFNWRNCFEINRSAALTNYQQGINISYSDIPNSETDFSDLVFYRQNDTNTVKIPFWIEAQSNGNWVNLTYRIDFVDTSEHICIYYNTDLPITSESDGHATFQFYDDCSSLNTTKWDIAGNATANNGICDIVTRTNAVNYMIGKLGIDSENWILELNGTMNGSQNFNGYFGAGGVGGFADNHTAFNVRNTTTTTPVNRIDGSDTFADVNVNATDWALMRLIYKNSSVDTEFYWNQTSIANVSGVPADTFWNITIGDPFNDGSPGAPGTLRFDWLRVFKFDDEGITQSGFLGEETTFRSIEEVWDFSNLALWLMIFTFLIPTAFMVLKNMPV